MSEQVMYDITPFPPMILKVNYDRFDWPKIKQFCEKVSSNNKEYNDTNWAGGDYASANDYKQIWI
jgi:hypothetical protein